MIRKNVVGAPPPRKLPAVAGKPALPPKKLSRAQVRAVAPRKTKSPVGVERLAVRGPMRHVEQPPLRRNQDYWASGCRVGDMIVAAEHMAEVVPGPSEERPVHPYLAADRYGYATGAHGGGFGDGTTSQPVPAGSVGVYAGTIRCVERGKGGNVSVLRHTAIFVSGRYVLSDLNLVDPAR